ncbi:LysR substrate-binding domain-containing protein [Promicromonospora iranensis]|uniref:DNA-binding transcriptional LysR family regulator n=1 Tax=Promicromonospora iranensis TaxID=1105144 RepID=A0ABU2CRP6_9MICO|nr:LysR substrate-binding domain-containing protein [Promicromonospora iranensis]MDR7384005.1 DNA-binding transcriptional LysR family regulator [Promicromonospora iranensis]
MSQPLPDVGPPVPGGDPADPSTAEPEAVDGPASADDADLDADADADADPSLPRFRLAYVPGASPGKWAAVWRERLPDVRLDLVQLEAAAVVPALAAGEADAAIGRLPVDKEVFSAIPLYEETSVVCFSRDHLLAALDEEEAVSTADITEDPVWVPADDVLFAAHPVPGVVPVDPDGNPLGPVPTTADAVATVAANVGVAVLPMSLARLHRRKDVTYRPLVDGPTAPVGLVWPTDRTTDLVEELIGIVRGRTVNSSRGRGGPATRQAVDGAAGASAGKSAKTGGKKPVKGGSGGTAGRSGGGRGGAKAGGRGGVQRSGGGVPRGKGARPTPKGKKKGKGR